MGGGNNESVHAAPSVSAASLKAKISTLPNVDSLSDVVIYSFFSLLDDTNASKLVDNVINVDSSEHKTIKDKSKTHRPDAPIIENWISDYEDETKIEPVTTAVTQSTVNCTRTVKNVFNKAHSPVRRPINQRPATKNSDFNKKVPTVNVNKVNVVQGNPQQALQDKGVIDSGCSRHMTRNISFLSEFKKIDGGYVAFGGNPKGGKISGKGKIKTGKLDFDDVYFVKELKFNLYTVLQMCDKKINVLFAYTECVVLSSNYKLPNENHVLLRVPRENNMYNVDLNNVVPLGGLACLFAKAILEESNLWHRRLGHINFKTINKPVKGNLVRGLPSKIFENNHTCVACQKGKQCKASCKSKPVSSISQPLQRLHMDLFGPTFVKSINKKCYCLVVTDDYSRMKGIKREFSVARTPQQNRVAKRKNRTLIVAARTMLADSLLPIPFWAKAVNIACYVQNRVLVTKPHNKTPYELLLGRSPSIGFMRPFGCPDTILYTLDPLGKFNGKANEGFLVGYSVNCKATRVFNRNENDVHVSANESDKTDTKKHDEKAKRDDKEKSHVDSIKGVRDLRAEFEEFSFNSTNRVNAISEPVNANGPNPTNNTNSFNTVSPSVNVVSPNFGITKQSSFMDPSKYLVDLEMPELEDIVYLNDEEDVGAKADLSNLETNIPVRKFNGKADEGFLVGYSVNCKLFRVFNSRTRIVQETLHVNFLETKPNVTGIGPKWLFDIDTLTMSRNYQPVVAGNQPNDNAGIKENLDADDDVADDAFEVKGNENDVHVSANESDKTDTKKHDEKAKRDDKEKSLVDSIKGARDLRAEFEEFSFNSTNRVNAVSEPVNANGPNPTNNTNSFNTVSPSVNVVSPNFGITKQSSFMDPSKYHVDLEMPELVDIVYSNDEEDVGAKADLSNLETNIPVSPIPNTRVHKDHPVNQIIGDMNSAPQTRSMTRMVKEQGGLHQINNEDFHTCSKWVFRKKKDERGIVIRNKARLVAQGHTQEEYTNYDDVFAPVVRLEAIRFFSLCFLYGFHGKQMDVKSAFLYGTIKEEVVVSEDVIQRDIYLDDADGVECLPNEDIFAELAQMGYKKPPPKLTFYKQFWATATMEKVNGEVQLQALIDEKKMFVTESIIRRDLHLDDADGVKCLPNAEIFEELARMGYENPPPNAKRTAWNEFSSSMASAVIYLSTGRKFNFSKYIFYSMVRNVDSLNDIEELFDQENVNAASKGVSVVISPWLVSTAEPTVFDDEDVTMIMAQTLIKLKAEKAKILDEKIAQKLHDEEVQLDSIKRYLDLRKKPVSVAQARKNMMIYLKNMAGYKLKFFKGMTYDEIKPIFEREYNKIQTLFKHYKDVQKTMKKRVANETLLQESFKKLRAAKVLGSESTQEIPTNDPKEITEEDVQNMFEIVLVPNFRVETLQGHDIYMLTKRLPFVIMILMLSGKMQVEEDKEMARDRVMKIFMEANRPRNKEFAIVENMDAYRDKDMGDVIIGKPFCRVACVEAK
nr:hypothetical protein [Tanacetum cinerariifolium]